MMVFKTLVPICWFVFGLLTSVFVCPNHCRAQANVSWNKTLHDFGEVERNSTCSTVFVMTNTTPKPIRIDNVRTNCGCTVADWRSSDLAPADTTHLVVAYHAPRRAKSFRQFVKVFINTNKKPYTLVLQGKTLK